MPKVTTGLSLGSWGASAGLPGQYPNNGSYKGAMFGTAQLIIGLLEKIGDLINREKSMLEPTQGLEYPGFVTDTVEMKFFFPGMKMQISARQLASFLGLLQATLPAIRTAPLYF